MIALFRDELHEDFGTWPIAYIPHGGADFGEVRAVAAAAGEGDDGAYFSAWDETGDCLSAEADAALAKGTAFDKGLALGKHPTAPLAIPFAQTSLSAYLIAAEGLEGEARPLIVFNNGYDCTITDTYFAREVAASRRGYHRLLFDGPGQGAMLCEHGVPLRPDWEVVIKAVVDIAVALPLVDAKRIALSGWSLGGYLAPRGASGEPRIAALIADAGTWGIADGFRDVIARTFGLPAEAVTDLGALDQAIMDKVEALISVNRRPNWKVVQRSFWTHGVGTLRTFLTETERFTMKGRAELISCPTLITQAEIDTLAAGCGAFAAALRCPTTLMRFTAAEGADGRCEMGRSLLNRRALDWLDERFAPGSRLLGHS